MKKIVAFIDNFPGESGFVTPIYTKDKNEYYVEKNIDKTIRQFTLDSSFMEHFKKTKNKKDAQYSKNLIVVQVDLPIPSNEMLMYAFKFNRNFIIIGDRKNIAKNILYGIGTIDNKLLIHNEIKSFISKTNIGNVNRYLEEALEYYEIKNLFNLQINESNSMDYLQHSAITDWRTEEYFQFQKMPNINEKSNFIKIIENENKAYEVNKEKIIFRLSKTRDKKTIGKDTIYRTEEDRFRTESARIRKFMELLTPNDSNEKVY